MEHSRDYTTRWGDWVIDSMHPVFNPDGTIILSPGDEFMQTFRQKHKIGDKVRFGTFKEAEKFAICEIVEMNDHLKVRPID